MVVYCSLSVVILVIPPTVHLSAEGRLDLVPPYIVFSIHEGTALNLLLPSCLVQVKYPGTTTPPSSPAVR